MFDVCAISNNTLRPRQNGRRFADDTFKCIFLNENVRISFKISLKFVPLGSINNIPALVRLMAWRRPGDKPLSEPMIVSLPTNICVTRPQWDKRLLNQESHGTTKRSSILYSSINYLFLYAFYWILFCKILLWIMMTESPYSISLLIWIPEKLMFISTDIMQSQTEVYQWMDI